MAQNAATARKMKSRRETTSSQPRPRGFSLHLFFKGKALGTRLPPTAKLRQWRQSRQRQAFINTDTRRFKIQTADMGPPPPPHHQQGLKIYTSSFVLEVLVLPMMVTTTRVLEGRILCRQSSLEVLMHSNGRLVVKRNFKNFSGIDFIMFCDNLEIMKVRC